MAGIPVFNTVAEAVRKTKANSSVIYVPPAFAADSIYEAVDAGIVVGLRRDDQVFVPHLRNTRQTPNEDVLRHLGRSARGGGQLRESNRIFLVHELTNREAAAKTEYLP